MFTISGNLIMSVQNVEVLHFLCYFKKPICGGFNKTLSTIANITDCVRVNYNSCQTENSPAGFQIPRAIVVEPTKNTVITISAVKSP